VPESLRFARSGAGAVGAALLLFVLLVALFGPFVAPYPPERPIGIPYEGPSAEALLGTDFLGRDVLSRILWGGRSVIALAGLSVLLAYAGGLVVGLAAGYAHGLLDPVLMRSADVLLSLPALLFLLVLVTGFGSSRTVLVVGVALIQLPLVARIIRTATEAQSVRGFVEAAAARGERTSAILRRELLPNIVPTIADLIEPCMPDGVCVHDPTDACDRDVDIEHVVELERLAVPHERLEHGHLDAFCPHRVVRMADVA